MHCTAIITAPEEKFGECNTLKYWSSVFYHLQKNIHFTTCSHIQNQCADKKWTREMTWTRSELLYRWSEEDNICCNIQLHPRSSPWREIMYIFRQQKGWAIQSPAALCQHLFCIHWTAEQWKGRGDRKKWRNTHWRNCLSMAQISTALFMLICHCTLAQAGCLVT